MYRSCVWGLVFGQFQGFDLCVSLYFLHSVRFIPDCGKKSYGGLVVTMGARLVSPFLAMFVCF